MVSLKNLALASGTLLLSNNVLAGPISPLASETISTIRSNEENILDNTRYATKDEGVSIDKRAAISIRDEEARSLENSLSEILGRSVEIDTRSSCPGSSNTNNGVRPPLLKPVDTSRPPYKKVGSLDDKLKGRSIKIDWNCLTDKQREALQGLENKVKNTFGGDD